MMLQKQSVRPSCGTRSLVSRCDVAGRPVRQSAVRAYASQQEHNTTSMPETSNRRSVLLSTVCGTATVLLAPSAQAKKAQPISPATLVNSILDKELQGDVDGIVSAQSKDVLWKFPAAYPGDPLGGEFKGRYGVLTYLTRQQKLLKNIKISDVKIGPGDGKDQVIARYRLSGSVANGGKFSTSVTQVWKLDANNQVAAMTAYYETAPLAKAAGKAVAA